MGVCDVVAQLADAISASKNPLTARQALLVHLLRAMPMYRDIRRLDCWEAAILNAHAIADDEPSGTARLLQAIFEFGPYNLYAAFDESGTRGEFSGLGRELAAAGISPPLDPDLRDW